MTPPRPAIPGTTASSPRDAGRDPVVYLHVGAPKSGTTFLQNMLWRNRRALTQDGVLFPARSRDHHFRAALDLRGIRFQGYDDPAVPGAWRRVVDLIQRWRGPTVVISHELLAWANEDQARQAVESLRPAEVHVVYTARDLARQLPAMWQESVKNGRVAGFAQYLQNVKTPKAGGGPGGLFWGSQDAVAVLGRWGAVVPADRIHVLTVPHADAPRDLLWARFAGLIGVDPGRYDTDVGGSNVSLGRAEVELLRRINLALDGKLEWPEYEPLIKHWLAERILAARPDAVRVSLPPRWHEWAVERSERLVAGLRDAGYEVVGDLEELLPRPLPEKGPSEPADPSRPGPGAVLDVAVDAIVQVLGNRNAPASLRRAPNSPSPPNPPPSRWRKRIARVRRRVGVTPIGRSVAAAMRPLRAGTDTRSTGH